MKRNSEKGMTLIEMMVVVMILGLIAGFAVPYMSGLSDTHKVRGATENIAGQMRMARATAIATGVTQRFHLHQGANGYDYHVHNGIGGIKTGWTLPPNVNFAWGTSQLAVDFLPTGHAASSASIVLTGRYGERDTISVEQSGYILIH